MQDTDLPKEVESTTPDFKTELAAKLQELVPEVVTDGKVDAQKLKELLDDDAADDSERFGLFWPGKKRAMRAAQEPTTATLKPAKDESKDWDTTENLFIEGDNLEVLKVLQKHYHNRIAMIYIDPPYNTGKDFVYPDNYQEGLANYLEFTKQVDSHGKKISTNSDTDGRYHTNWLNMMYPRLKLARNLLTDDGLIFISIDDSELDNLKKLCDEIFGESNFVANIAVEMSKTQGMKVAAAQNGQIVKNHEYIIVYARNILFNTERQALYDASEYYDNHYDIYLDEHKETSNLLDKLKNDDKSVQAFAQYGLKISKNNLKTLLSIDTNYYDYFIKNIAPNLYRESMISLSDVQALDIPIGKVTAYKKYLLRKNSSGTVSQLQGFLDGVKNTDDYKPVFQRATIRGALWKGFYSDMMNIGKEGGIEFKNGKKPIRLLKQLAKWTNRKDSIVLDFFAGSGSTAEAMMALNSEDGGNRKFILVQLPEPIHSTSGTSNKKFNTIADLTKSRLVNAANKISGIDENVDTGFRVFKLADSNFTKWRTDSATDKDSLQQHLLDIRESSNDAASEEDLLTEVLLKQGISLTAPLKHVDIEGLSTWVVGDNVVAAYLNEHTKPSLDQLRAIVATEPAKFIILEDAFQGDDELKTNLVQICKSQKIELWTV